MADDNQDQKTEEPTARRLKQARDRGETPNVPEVRHALMFVAMTVAVGGVGAWSLARLSRFFTIVWGSADDYALTQDGFQAFMTGVMFRSGMALLPLIGLFFGAAFLIVFLQGSPSLSWSRVAPKWSKVSPMSGLGRIYGRRAFVEFAKTLVKFAVVVSIGLLIAWPHAVAFDQLIGASPDRLVTAAGTIVFGMVKAVAILVVALAAFDYVYQHRAFLKRMRMTLQELRDEIKESDGDPKIKARIRAIGLQRAKRRMMAAVPEASVVITNPTHYAVALQYTHGEMAAPVVVAKGVDEVALKIREVATAARVPIVESPPLARALFAGADIDRPIPVEHYAAVAEIIGYVLRLARQRD
ncbi:flagellar biosynthesis protein FlhB [Sphingomonas sp. AP4-R1]|uniref:flagellar biosynthesis protein FlhB n=1 Tax=Sphingomonas sp. AP4-R1 TaxID=2735134 RepID=UPI0014934019|nr:flagellar biosynthesis protein FlhB [Sphingomonas sp. AP4-R1]QJU57418.1 flagellar biosynthesis protein FlhB [Sphingomonas sp. AP4-R1]